MFISVTQPQSPFVHALLIISLMMYGAGIHAHHPHDIVDALAISPSFHEDHTIFIANSYHLFRSENSGYSWKELVNGFDNIHPVSSIDIAPAENGSLTIFVATSGNGIYRSTNNGDTWKNVNSGLQNLDIRKLSVRSHGIILALDNEGHLYTTSNNGDTWLPAILPQGTVISSISPPTQFPLTGILAGGSLGQVLLSTDNGVNWRTVGQLPVKTEITVITFDPIDDSGTTYFIGTQDNGLYKTSNNGTSFGPVGNSLVGHHIESLAFSPNYRTDNRLLVTTWREAVFISADRGDTWTKHDSGLTTDKQADTAKYLSPYFSQIKILASDSNTMYLAAFTGLYKSVNGGRSWVELETLPVSHIKSLALSTISQDNNYSVGIGTYGGGAYITHDRGKTWTIGNKGLNTTRIGDIVFTPSYPEDNTLFAGANGLLLKSTDNGATWNRIPLHYKSLKRKVINKLISFGLSSDFGRSMLNFAETHGVYPSAIATSPDYSTDNTVFIGTRWHGMYRSEDGGLTSENIWHERKGVITSINISPDFSTDHTLFAYVYGDGVYKSEDRGDSWNRIVNGLPFDNQDKADDNKHKVSGKFVIAFSAEYNKDRTLFAGGIDGLFKSIDQGDNWNKLMDNMLGPSPNILAMGVSPSYNNEQTLLVSVKGQGLYKSLDGGDSFSEVAKSLIENNHSIELIQFSSDFSQNSTVYAASDEHLFRTSDRGENWENVTRPVRYEDRRDVIRYIGQWDQVESNEYSASTIHFSESAGDRAKLSFVGCGIRWISTKSPQGGIANVYLDEKFLSSVDLYAEQSEYMSDVFTRTGLACKPHTITIEVNDGKAKHSHGHRVTLDAFDVLPAEL